MPTGRRNFKADQGKYSTTTQYKGLNVKSQKDTASLRGTRSLLLSREPPRPGSLLSPHRPPTDWSDQVELNRKVVARPPPAINPCSWKVLSPCTGIEPAVSPRQLASRHSREALPAPRSGWLRTTKANSFSPNKKQKHVPVPTVKTRAAQSAYPLPAAIVPAQSGPDTERQSVCRCPPNPEEGSNAYPLSYPPRHQTNRSASSLPVHVGVDCPLKLYTCKKPWRAWQTD